MRIEPPEVLDARTEIITVVGQQHRAQRDRRRAETGHDQSDTHQRGPQPTRPAPRVHQGYPAAASGGDVGVAASITRLNQPGPASSRTVGVASTVVAGSASAATAASIAGVFSRTTFRCGADRYRIDVGCDRVPHRRVVGNRADQAAPAVRRAAHQLAVGFADRIDLDDAGALHRKAVTASRAIHGGTVAPNRPRQSGGSSG